jgi:hypothetical protein
MTFKTPSGTPALLASWNQFEVQFLGLNSTGHTSMMARLVYGVSDGTLITAVHPVAMTGATFRAIIAAGKFHLYISLSFLQPQTATHGTSKEQTPIGCLMTIFLVPLTELGTTCP